MLSSYVNFYKTYFKMFSHFNFLNNTTNNSPRAWDHALVKFCKFMFMLASIYCVTNYDFMINLVKFCIEIKGRCLTN